MYVIDIEKYFKFFVIKTTVPNKRKWLIITDFGLGSYG